MSFNFVIENFTIGGESPDLSPNFIFYRRGFNLGSGFSQPSWKDIILHGVTALTLVNSKADSLNYLKLFGNTEQLPETYIDSVTLEGKCEQRNLPEGYTQVAYIETDGTQYIDTGIVPSLNMSAEIKGQFLTVDTNSAHFLSARSGASGYNTLLAWNNNSGGGYYTQFFYDSYYSRYVTPKDTNVNVITGAITATSCTTGYNGQVATSTANNVAQNMSLYLNARHIDNGATDIGTYRYYYAKIWKDGILVRDFIPAKNSSNVVGLYDTVTGTFFTNEGTGDFVAGADVTTPSPDTPIDIVCNNGVVKVSPNLFNKNSYTEINAYVNSSTGILTQGSPGEVTQYCAVIPCLPNTTYTISGRSNSAWGAFTSSTIGATATSFSKAGNGSITTGANDIYLIGLVRANLNQIDYRNTLQVEQGSTATTYMPYGETYIDGTREVVTDSLGNTANAEMLLSVGDYKDTQEVLSGDITRNIGIKVLDGTENWTASGNLFYADIATDALEDTHSCYCTHFKGVATNASATYNNEIKVGTNATASVKWTRVQMYPVVGTYSDVNAFTQWLSDQYNAGTPVIVIYPTNSPTTETVSGQFLSKSPVTQTAGSISNLPIAITESSHTTPTPQQPLPINCNNGVVKVIQNLIDLNAVTDGYYYDPQGVYTPLANSRLTDYIPIEAGQSVTIYFKSLFSTSNLNVRINLFNSSKVWQSQEVLQLSPLADGTKIITPTDNGYIRVSGNYTSTTGAIVDWNTAKVVYGEYTVATIDSAIGSIYVDGTTETVEVVGKNLIDMTKLTPSKYINASGTITNGGYGYSDFIPVVAGAKYTYNATYTDTTTQTRIHGYKDGVWQQQIFSGSAAYYPQTMTIPAGINQVRISFYPLPTNPQFEVGESATTYEPYYNGGSATAEMLLKVGTYQDVQSVLDGEVKRKVGIKVFDGTEDWVQHTSYANIQYFDLSNSALTAGAMAIPCTHYVGTPAANANMPTDSIKITTRAGATSGSIFVKSDYTSANGLKQFLSDQYNVGTPVIIVYPTRFTTTETVTAQPLTIQAGTNVVEITQASMDNLELEVSYKAGVSVTVTEIENAQLDNSVEVTVNG